MTDNKYGGFHLCGECGKEIKNGKFCKHEIPKIKGDRDMKIHKTKYHGYLYSMTLCGLNVPHDESTAISQDVTCKECLRIMKETGKLKKAVTEFEQSKDAALCDPTCQLYDGRICDCKDTCQQRQLWLKGAEL